MKHYFIKSHTSHIIYDIVSPCLKRFVVPLEFNLQATSTWGKLFLSQYSSTFFVSCLAMVSSSKGTLPFSRSSLSWIRWLCMFSIRSSRGKSDKICSKTKLIRKTIEINNHKILSTHLTLMKNRFYKTNTIICISQRVEIKEWSEKKIIFVVRNSVLLL